MRVEIDAVDRVAELESLRDWLAEVDQLRGLVRSVESPPPSHVLGPVVDSLEVVVGPVATAVAASVVAWVRSRSGRVTVRLERPDGTKLTIDAARVRGLSPADVHAEVDRVLKAIEGPGEQPE
ncbi:hypothetical protein GCM10010483_53280 [Actinokineospora diospyrosa]